MEKNVTFVVFTIKRFIIATLIDHDFWMFPFQKVNILENDLMEKDVVTYYLVRIPDTSVYVTLELCMLLVKMY